MVQSKLASLVETLLDGDQNLAVVKVKELRNMGIGRERIVVDAIEKAMARLDTKCTVEAFNLLEIMMCGRAVTGVIRELYPKHGPPRSTRGTIVVGTLEGDFHDLGKNIFKMVLLANGYEVVDCGRDCSLDRIVGTAERKSALAIGVSGLISTVMPQARRLRPMVAKQGLEHIRILAGGGAFKQVSAHDLNVDFVAQTSFDVLPYLDGLVEWQQ